MWKEDIWIIIRMHPVPLSRRRFYVCDLDIAIVGNYPSLPSSLVPHHLPLGHEEHRYDVCLAPERPVSRGGDEIPLQGDDLPTRLLPTLAIARSGWSPAIAAALIRTRRPSALSQAMQYYRA